jgi:uncharacterized protein
VLAALLAAATTGRGGLGGAERPPAQLASARFILALAKETLPPPPDHYFNDYAGVVPADAAARLEARLKAFDEETSNQIVVAIFPELPSPSLEDFTIRTAQSWRVGRKKLDNGVVLFVFVKDRKIRIEVGYGLEGALPDATASQIISDLIVPRFRAGGYAGGIEAAVDAFIAATRGEYKAEPRPVSSAPAPIPGWVIFLFILIFFVIPLWRRARRGPRTYHRRGWDTPWWWGTGGGGGGWSSGGGGGGFGGGGFSGGGGSFGGGGASGSW